MFYVVHRSLACASASQHVLVSAETSVFPSPESESHTAKNVFFSSRFWRMMSVAHAQEIANTRRVRHTVNEIYDVLREKIRIFIFTLSILIFCSPTLSDRILLRKCTKCFSSSRNLLALATHCAAANVCYERDSTLASSHVSVSKVIFIVPDNTTELNKRRKKSVELFFFLWNLFFIKFSMRRIRVGLVRHSMVWIICWFYQCENGTIYPSPECKEIDKIRCGTKTAEKNFISECIWAFRDDNSLTKSVDTMMTSEENRMNNVRTEKFDKFL